MKRHLSLGIFLVVALLGSASLRAQDPWVVDPPARNPVPAGEPVPAGPPADPAAPPPAREPVPVGPLPREGETDPALEAAETVDPSTRPAVPETEPFTGAPEEQAGKQAVDPSTVAIAPVPLQEVPEPLLPRQALPAVEEHLLAYRAAALGEVETALDHYELALVGEPDNLRWGTEYRQLIIATGKYVRGLRFLGRLTEKNPSAANLHLNLGYAYVDKVPEEGALSRLMLAGNAVREFSRALELEESWLGYYTRGNSYVFWPPAFGRTLLGIADLERAIELAKKEPKRPYHARAWAVLGDGFWRLGKREEMRKAWRQGLELFPASPDLKARTEGGDADLDVYLNRIYDLGTRVDTSLEEIWQARREAAP